LCIDVFHFFISSFLSQGETKTMNKLYKLLSIIALFSLVLSACVAPPPLQAPAEGSASVAADAPVATVRYDYPNTVFKDVQLVEDALNELLVPIANAKIELNPIDWGAFDEKMKLGFAAGEECDIVFTAPWINNYLLNIANGNLLPLDDLLLDYAPGLWASMPETTWDAARVDGKIYGVINQQIFVKPFGLNVRKDLADKYGLDVYALKSYDELEPFLQTILEKEADVLPLSGTGSWTNEGAGFDPIVSEQVPVAIRYNDKESSMLRRLLNFRLPSNAHENGISPVMRPRKPSSVTMPRPCGRQGNLPSAVWPVSSSPVAKLKASSALGSRSTPNP
jgi:hypothetical protein